MKRNSRTLLVLLVLALTFSSFGATPVMLAGALGDESTSTVVPIKTDPTKEDKTETAANDEATVASRPLSEDAAAPASALAQKAKAQSALAMVQGANALTEGYDNGTMVVESVSSGGLKAKVNALLVDAGLTGTQTNWNLITTFIIAPSTTGTGNTINKTDMTFVRDNLQKAAVVDFSGATLSESITGFKYAVTSTKTILKKITMPQGITEIPKQCFWGSTVLEEVHFGTSVKKLVSYCFYDCPVLRVIDDLTGVEELEDGIFKSTNIATLAFSSNLKTIGDDAFFGQKSITSLGDLSGITTLGNQVFSGCNKLVRVNFSSNLTELPSGTFSGCSVLESVGDMSGITSVGRSAFLSCYKLSSLNFSDALTAVDERAFASCSVLETVGNFENVTTIGDYAFDTCGSLTSLNLTDKITSIGTNTFYYCMKLTTIGEGAFDNCVSIGKKAFLCCYSLETGIDLSNVSTLGEAAFGYCVLLDEDVVFPVASATIGDAAFEGCAFDLTTGQIFTGNPADVMRLFAAQVPKIHFEFSDENHKEIKVGDTFDIASMYSITTRYGTSYQEMVEDGAAVYPWLAFDMTIPIGRTHTTTMPSVTIDPETVDTSVAGTTTFHYTITNNYNATQYDLEFVLDVVKETQIPDPPIIVGKPKVISSSTFYILQGESLTQAQFLAAIGAQAFDSKGNPLSPSQISIDGWGSLDFSKANYPGGQPYTVRLSVTDGEETSNYRTVVVYVMPKDTPVYPVDPSDPGAKDLPEPPKGYKWGKTGEGSYILVPGETVYSKKVATSHVVSSTTSSPLTGDSSMVPPVSLLLLALFGVLISAYKRKGTMR